MAFHYFPSLLPVSTNPVNQVESVLVQPSGVLGLIVADGIKQFILILTIEGTLTEKGKRRTYVRT